MPAFVKNPAKQRKKTEKEDYGKLVTANDRIKFIAEHLGLE